MLASYMPCAACPASLVQCAAIRGACVAGHSRLHGDMVGGVLGAPPLFFQANPVGRIMNRCGCEDGVCCWLGSTPVSVG